MPVHANFLAQFYLIWQNQACTLGSAWEQGAYREPCLTKQQKEEFCWGCWHAFWDVVFEEEHLRIGEEPSPTFHLEKYKPPSALRMLCCEWILVSVVHRSLTLLFNYINTDEGYLTNIMAKLMSKNWTMQIRWQEIRGDKNARWSLVPVLVCCKIIPVSHNFLSGFMWACPLAEPYLPQTVLLGVFSKCDCTLYHMNYSWFSTDKWHNSFYSYCDWWFICHLPATINSTRPKY